MVLGLGLLVGQNKTSEDKAVASRGMVISVFHLTDVVFISRENSQESSC